MNHTRYPWGNLAVGQSFTTTLANSFSGLTTVRVSLAYWRKKQFATGLYSLEHGPRFAVEPQPDRPWVVRITRLADGPVLAVSRLETSTLAQADRIERDTVERRIADWQYAFSLAEFAGQPLPVPPLDLVEAAYRIDPELARRDLVDHHFHVLRNRKDIVGLTEAEERELVAQTRARQARRATDHEPRRRATDCGPHRRATDAPHDCDAWHDAHLCDKLSAACSKSHN